MNDSDNLFVKVFPCYAGIHRLNAQRMKQFKNFTIDVLEGGPPAATVQKPAIEPLLKMNSLGFYTVDSQEGGVQVDENPNFAYGEEKGLREYKRNTAGKKIPMTQRQTTELPAVIGFIPIKLATCLKKYFDNNRHVFFKLVEVVGEDEDEDDIDITFYRHAYENGSTDFERFTTYPLKMHESIYDYYNDVLTEDDPSSYGGGIEGLVLDRKEWALAHFIDFDTRVSASDPTDGLFYEIVKALTYSLEKCGSQKGRGRVRKTKRIVKKRRAHTKKTVRR